MNKRAILVVAMVLVACLACFNVFAWLEAGHYGIGRIMKGGRFSPITTNGMTVVVCTPTTPLSQAEQLSGGRRNFPDVWPSMTGLAVSDEFTWTHDMLRTGGVIIPNTPVYAKPTREPGMMMGRLLPKVKSWATTPDLPCPTPQQDEDAKTLAIATALGFAEHNAMDHVVHYKYFLGGTQKKWVNQHGRKERWADMILLGAPNCFNTTTDTLNTFYEMALPTTDGTIIPIDGNAKIIHLAQKVARKNRQCMDMKRHGKKQVPNTKTAWQHVESMGAINKKITDMEQSMTKDMNGYNLKTGHYDPRNPTFQSFNQLSAEAKKNNNQWTIAGLLLATTSATIAAQNVKIVVP